MVSICVDNMGNVFEMTQKWSVAHEHLSFQMVNLDFNLSTPSEPWSGFLFKTLAQSRNKIKTKNLSNAERFQAWAEGVVLNNTNLISLLQIADCAQEQRHHRGGRRWKHHKIFKVYKVITVRGKTCKLLSASRSCGKIWIIVNDYVSSISS